MDVDIIGIVENMSYVKCPECDKKIYMFGKSHSQEVADRYQLPLLGQLPIDSELTQLSVRDMLKIIILIGLMIFLQK